MKYFQMFGLLAVVAAALMAFASMAFATSVTTVTGGAAATPTIRAETTGGPVVLHTSLFATLECNGTAEGNVEAHGQGEAVWGRIRSLTLTNCTSPGISVTVTSPINVAGSLSVTWTSGYNGILTSTGAQISMYSHTYGGTCVYTTNNTKIGTVTGGSPAILDIEAAAIPRTGGTLGSFCGPTGTWTGSYKVTSPGWLYINS